MLDKAKLSDPAAWWWIKADGVDVVKGLCESTSGVWSGDIDLNDGQLDQLYRIYSERLKFVKGIGLNDRKEGPTITADLEQVLEFIKEDYRFITKGTLPA